MNTTKYSLLVKLSEEKKVTPSLRDVLQYILHNYRCLVKIDIVLLGFVIHIQIILLTGRCLDVNHYS